MPPFSCTQYKQKKLLNSENGWLKSLQKKDIRYGPSQELIEIGSSSSAQHTH